MPPPALYSEDVPPAMTSVTGRRRRLFTGGTFLRQLFCYPSTKSSAAFFGRVSMSQSRELLEESAGPDPLALFRRWYDDALAAGLPQPEAMTLATATPEGVPSARVVLLRGFDEAGFRFYTNYQSRKGREMAANPR